ncbi:MAG: hypothetical protein GF313_05195 [Caldithrix sp.]|nr:hypothetical protein [Caldithrix sp.]
MKKLSHRLIVFALLWLMIGLIPQTADAQRYQWMNAGALHNWFSEMGNEIEIGRSSSAAQQDGLQWPAILPYQDIQAAKGFWIGCKDFTDERGDNYPYKVITVGPRSKGFGEFFPTKFDLVSKFEQPQIYVDGLLTYEKSVEVDYVDPTIPADRMIFNELNTLLGLKMERKIMQFSHENHDNYMVYDYTFTNTGNIDDDAEIELPDQTLTDVYFFWQYRYAPCFQTRYIIGNGTGWGMNTMHDARGDGDENPDLYGDPQDEREYNGKEIRTQFAWHGYFPDKVVDYDNIGGPIWRVYQPYVAEYDTIGRLGAPQFAGILTLHADQSATDDTDDPAQPTTTGWYGSDLPETGPNSDPYNVQEMQERYAWMEYGHMKPRHAWAVEKSGDFVNQTNGPNLDLSPPKSGRPGGFSIGNGYGPYEIPPGESIRIIMVEAVDGLGTEKCIEYGRQYKNGVIDAETKNEYVLSGKDSLFNTYRNAIDNYQAGWEIPNPPKPPKLFEVTGGGDRISLSWDVFDTENLAGFRIYRNKGEYDNPIEPPELIYEAGKDERSFDDLTPVRGVGYFYYIQSIGENGLVSSRYYTQTFDPAFLKRPQGGSPIDEDRYSLDAVRVVPNPYIISSSDERLKFPGERDKLAFFNIPGQCKITIFTENGELVETINHTDGSGDAYWNATTYSNQVVVSGVYIAHIEVTADIPGEQPGQLLYEKGDSKVIKFVVVR